MTRQVIIVVVVLALLPLVLKLAVKSRLIVPLLYILVVSVFFPVWATEHEVLSFGILGLLTVLVIISWLWPVICRIREERITKKALLFQIKSARQSSTEPLSVTFTDGVPLVRTRKE